jgi:hypothetical protein
MEKASFLCARRADISLVTASTIMIPPPAPSKPLAHPAAKPASKRQSVREDGLTVCFIFSPLLYLRKFIL